MRRVPVWVARDGKETPLPLDAGPYRFPRLSPDGARLAIGRSDLQANTSDVWLYAVTGTSASRLTFDGQSTAPVWTSDGRRLAFSAVGINQINQGLRIFVQDADGTGRPKVLAESRYNRYPYAWFDGNTKLMFTELHEGGALDIGVIDASGGATRMLLSSPAWETRPDVSPDGRSPTRRTSPAATRSTSVRSPTSRAANGRCRAMVVTPRSGRREDANSSSADRAN